MKRFKITTATKQKIKDLKIPLYARELSVVIIGVAVTFWVSGIIAEKKEKRDLDNQLESIYIELQDNLLKVDDLAAFYRKHKRLKQLLSDYVRNPQPSLKDSINSYSHIAFGSNVFSFKKGAYQMFINSGEMKSIRDKQLLIDITESYLYLELLKEDHDKHVELKYQEFGKLYSSIDKEFLLIRKIDLTDPQFNSIFNFHALNEGLGSILTTTRKQLEKTINKKEKNK